MMHAMLMLFGFLMLLLVLDMVRPRASSIRVLDLTPMIGRRKQ